MGFAQVFVTDNDGSQHEIDRIVFNGRDVQSFNDSNEARMILDSSIQTNEGDLGLNDGERFIRALASAYSGTRLRVGRYVDSGKGHKYPGQPRDDHGRFGSGGGMMAPDDGGANISGGSGGGFSGDVDDSYIVNRRDNEMITDTKTAADVHVQNMRLFMKSLKIGDPEKYERWMTDDFSFEEIRENWTKAYRKRSDFKDNLAAFTDLNPERKRICQEAVDYNKQNELLQQVVAKGPPLSVIFTRPEKGNGANGQAVGHTIRIYDQWNDTAFSDEQGIGTVILGSGVAGVIRHEYGHMLHDGKLTKAQYDAWQTRWASNTGKIEKEISGYAATNANEYFAETFTMATHPKYKPETVGSFARESAELLMGWVLQ